jgi:hypothetical protein
MQYIFQLHTFPFMYLQRYKRRCSLHMTTSQKKKKLKHTKNTSHDKFIYITVIRVLEIFTENSFWLYREVVQGK